MKLPIITCLFLISISIMCKAQDKDEQFSTERKSTFSNYIVEGEVIKKVCFLNKDTSSIYTAAFVKVSRIFKGEGIDSIIEIVYRGGNCPGGFSAHGQMDIQAVVVSHGIALKEGEEGIFFLNPNNTTNKRQDNLQSYLPNYGKGSLILYQGGGQASLEAGVYKDIVAVTGQPIKVLGQNMFERPAQKK